MISFIKDDIEYRFFDHLYAVSECGKVLRNFLPYTPSVRNDRYLALGRQRLMHRVVAICWVPNPTNSKCVHHKNGDKSDNRAENLEWVTYQEHADHHPEWKTPYKRSPETIAKFIASRTGVKDSPESAAVKRKNLDKIRPSTVCKFQGVTYPSVASAARAAGIPTPTFRVRAISKNFPEYEIVRLYYGSPDI